MVLQVRTDLRLIEDDGNAEIRQMVGGTDAGKLEDARRADGAGRQDHLRRSRQPRSVGQLDAPGAPVLDDDAADLRPGADRQVLSAPVRREIGHRRRRTPRIALGELVEADAVLLFAGHVLVARDAELRGSLEIGLADRQRRARPRHAERPALAVKLVVESVVVLGLPEIGQHVVIAPAVAAHLAPLVIIERVAAGVDLRVDRRAAADHLGLGVAEDPIVHVALRHRRPAPRADALGHFRKARRQMIERVPVAAAGLEKEDLCVRVFGQPRGENATGRAAADDDEVVSLSHCR